MMILYIKTNPVPNQKLFIFIRKNVVSQENISVTFLTNTMAMEVRKKKQKQKTTTTTIKGKKRK